MSLQSLNILNGLQRLSNPGQKVLDGSVTSVDASAFTCVVKLASGLLINDVQLKALKEAAKGVVIVPKVGSHVQMVQIGNNEYLVIAVEEADKIYMDAETEIIINGGENKGLVVLEKLQANLDALKDYIKNDLESAVKDGLQAVGVSTSANGPAAAASFQAAVASKQISFENMENEKVKH